MNDPRIIVALDYPTAAAALDFARQVSPKQCRLKVGNELFTSAGPALVESLIDIGYDVFLDLKYHDIPNTVRQAAAAASRLGVWMLNVHALGGTTMMQAAREGAEVASHRPYVIAVTILTSHSSDDLKTLGIGAPLPQMVEDLARQALDSGLDGVVCSAREAAALRSGVGQSALLVTPGIRPEWADSNDQQRIVTPEQALADGASYLVIGRPITAHREPAEALQLINESISRAA